MGAAGTKGLWRQVPRAEREEQMLAAATTLFTERGYANVSMEAIAAQTGITKPLLYSYFGSKEGLYAACIARFLAPLEHAITQGIDESLPPEGRLWTGTLAVLRFVGDHSAEWGRFYVEPVAHGELPATTIAEARARAVDQLTRMFAKACRDSGLPEELVAEVPYQVHIFVGGVESLARWWVAHPDDATAEQLAVRLVNQVWMGFGDLLQGRLWTMPDAR